MATLKLKQPAVPKTAETRRAPIRGQGPKRPRPTLAQAEAERAQRHAEAAAPPRDRAEPPARRARDDAPTS
ncbi:MAG TPA: pseudouridine synthase, partial [Methylibium sp.]|nr:pseudouridine synthase [Methylibium sp.]